MLYRAKRVAAVTMSEEQTVAAQATDSVHARGSADAPVTLEEFGDFQCPPCGRLAESLREIEKDYGARLRVTFRNFPFASHEHAREAAYAAEAAGLQGIFGRCTTCFIGNRPTGLKQRMCSRYLLLMPGCLA